MVFLALSGLTALSPGAVITLGDFSGATSLVDARIQGAALTSGVDSVRYRHLTPRDTLASGTFFRSAPFNYPSVWPTLASTAENDFNLSYLIYKDNVLQPGGNYYMEKRFRLDTLNNRLNFYCLPTAASAHRDSAGTFLSKRISPPSGAGLIVGGVNTRSLIGPDQRIFRVCEGYGGGRDSVYVLDTVESGFGPSFQSFGTALETGSLTSKTYPDYCLNARGDTIFAAYTPNASGTQYLRVTPIRITGRDTVSKGNYVTVLTSPTETRRDISIDRDSATGRFLIACLKNESILELTATDPGLGNPVSLDARTGLPVISQISRNIRVAALGNQRFAVAWWMTLDGSGGVHLRIVDVSSGIQILDSVTLEPNKGLVPSLSVRNGRLAAAWLKETKAGANTGQVWGKIFTLESGRIVDTLFSGALSGDTTITKLVNAAPGNYCTAVALDTTGNFMAAYAKQDRSVYVTAWAPMYYYADTGTAEVEDSLSTVGWGDLGQDSIVYTGFAAQNNGNGGSVNLFFRSSASLTFSTPFTRAGADTVRGPLIGSHFQFRVQLLAGAGALTKPVITSLGFNVNVKPGRARIDSFTLNSGAFQAVQQAGDTLTLVSRMDTLKLVSSGADYDDASFMTLSLNGYAALNETMLRDSARHYSKTSMILPVNHRDTVYALKMSVKDTTNWGSDTFTLHVKLRNSLPVIRVSDTVFLCDVKTGRALSDRDTVRFMKRHKAVFRADFSDTNDAFGLAGSSAVNGVQRRVFSGTPTFLDTLTEADLPGDTCRYSITVSDPSGGTDSVRFTVIAYNRPPSMTVSDTVYLFAAKTGRALSNLDTVRFMKRHKTVFRADYSDSNDALQLTGRTYVNGLLRRSYANVQTLLDTLTLPDLGSDTGRYSMTVTDPSGSRDSASFTVIAYNRPPTDSIRKQGFDVRHAPGVDTLLTSGETLFVTDSGYAVLRCFGRDSNETDLRHFLLVSGVAVDSAVDTVYFSDTLYADSIHGLMSLAVAVSDSFTSDTIRFFTRVRHAPRLDSIVHKNTGARLTRDTVLNIINGIPDTFIVYATDPDVVIDDRLTYGMFIDSLVDTSVGATALSALFIHHPSRTEKWADFRVLDRSGIIKLMRIRLLYPSFETGPTFVQDSIYFADSLRVTVTRTGAVMDSVSAQSRSIKILNTGTDDLRILSASFLSGDTAAGWFRLGYAHAPVGAVSYSRRLGGPRVLVPGDSVFLFIRDSAAVAYGDSGGIRLSLGRADTTVYDTLLIITSDPERDSIRLPITIRCSEPPFVVRDTVLFVGSVPALSKTKDYAPRNAVYREIAMVFSEPMTHSAASAFQVYSRADSLVYAEGRSDTTAPFPGTLRWSKGNESRFDTLFFRPTLTADNYVSRHFGFSAPDGFFISTDPVRIKLFSHLTDVSGNSMDLDGNRLPDSTGVFKIFRTQVDSAGLKVVATNPANGSEGAPVQPVITIRFSSPLDPLSVDTSSVNNRTVRISSSISPATSITLQDGLAVSGNLLTFTPSARFYGGDSISVVVSSSLRDTNRNTLDGNNDGVGRFFYTDSLSAAGDNFSFRFWTAREDFYFYPCPFEPGRNPRHQALGGVVFKNLHSLFKQGQSGALDFRIYNVAGDLVYSSAKKGEAVNFGPAYGALSKPEWTWRAVNNTSRSVGSGLYLFVIADKSGRAVLNRGKLMVIR